MKMFQKNFILTHIIFQKFRPTFVAVFIFGTRYMVAFVYFFTFAFASTLLASFEI